MKNLFLIFIIFSCFILGSCSKSESGGSIVSPSETDPYIIDAVLSTNISNNLPSGITNYFYQGEEVNLWVHWANVTKGQRITVEWWTPSNNKESEYTVTFQSTLNRQMTIHNLKLSSFASTGEWQAKLFLENSFMRSYRFMVGQQ